MSTQSFKLPQKHIALLDELVVRGTFKSRGEAIRAAVDDLVREWTMSDLPEHDQLVEQQVERGEQLAVS